MAHEMHDSPSPGKAVMGWPAISGFFRQLESQVEVAPGPGSQGHSTGNGQEDEGG